MTEAPAIASPQASARIPELDGIRGIAIGMVLLHHYFYLAIRARPATTLSYAFVSGRLLWSGVDLFFVLSGFLIGGILMDARSSTNYFRVFYTRRFFRIVPIYAVCLMCGLGLTTLSRFGAAQKLGWAPQGQLPWLPYFAFLQNFWMSYRNTLGLLPLSVTWSLAVEEQFYLTLPTLVRFLNRKRLLSVVCAGVLAAPVLRTLLFIKWPVHQFSWVVLMPCRADALLIGVLAAFAMRDCRLRSKLESSRRLIQVALAILALGLAYLAIRDGSPYGRTMLMVGFSWLAAFYVCVLLYGLLFRDSWISSCFRWGWLRWLGSIAYGVYLFHEFVRASLFGLIWSKAPVITSAPELLVSILALAFTLLGCWLSWTYFEKPLVTVGHRVRYQWRDTQGGLDVIELSQGLIGKKTSREKGAHEAG